MHTQPFPEHIDLWRLTTEGAHLESTLPLESFPRLAPLLELTHGAVAISLVMDTDPHGIRRIHCGLRAKVVLVCQRCLEQMTYPLVVSTTLALVRTEDDADRLPDAYEPLFVTEALTAVADVIEDELLLALPQIPRHEKSQACAAREPYLSSPSSDTSQDTQQPFVGLADLLRDVKSPPSSTLKTRRN